MRIRNAAAELQRAGLLIAEAASGSFLGSCVVPFEHLGVSPPSASPYSFFTPHSLASLSAVCSGSFLTVSTNQSDGSGN